MRSHVSRPRLWCRCEGRQLLHNVSSFVPYKKLHESPLNTTLDWDKKSGDAKIIAKQYFLQYCQFADSFLAKEFVLHLDSSNIRLNPTIYLEPWNNLFNLCIRGDLPDTILASRGKLIDECIMKEPQLLLLHFCCRLWNGNE